VSRATSQRRATRPDRRTPGKTSVAGPFSLVVWAADRLSFDDATLSIVSVGGRGRRQRRLRVRAAGKANRFDRAYTRQTFRRFLRVTLVSRPHDELQFFMAVAKKDDENVSARVNMETIFGHLQKTNRICTVASRKVY